MTATATRGIWQRKAQQKLRERRARPDHSPTPTKEYRFAPLDYIQEKLGWEPWGGLSGKAGQVEVIDAYRTALLQMHERQDWEDGKLSTADLRYWKPGQVIKNWIRIQSGHSIGKTKLLSGLFSHFFDNCGPCVVYTFAPSYPQINDLLWKEIRTDRRANKLPGRVLEKPELKFKPNWFAKGRATNNAGNRGSERIQGQHGRYLMFIVDEAEGVADFVYDAIEAMATGGIVIVILAANPRTRTSRFYRLKEREHVANFQISCHDHINVITGRSHIMGGVTQEWVRQQMEKDTTVVPEHDEDRHTFEVPWEPGVIYRPGNEYLWRVMGIAPSDSLVDTFVPVGRYEAALTRPPLDESKKKARIGIDAARWGNDYGTIYLRHAGSVRRVAQLFHLDTFEYYLAVRDLVQALISEGVIDVEVRIDGTGGFGGGVVDQLARDDLLHQQLTRFVIREVHFGASAHNTKAYADIATEMYAETAESLHGLRVVDPPEELEADLTERKYVQVNRQGRILKKLEDKDVFKKRRGRSPDDGDGFVLAVAPDFIFSEKEERPATGRAKVVSREDLFGG